MVSFLTLGEFGEPNLRFDYGDWGGRYGDVTGLCFNRALFFSRGLEN